MPRINPIRLKTLREGKPLSLEQLAARSKINKSTIHRIEKGELAQNNRHTIEALARSLGVEPIELTSLEPPPPATARAARGRRQQISLRVEGEVRNALSFVATRYGIKQGTIVDLAPLLFVILAEESLSDRAEKLERFRTAFEQLDSVPPTWREGTASHMEQERLSILSRDILGRMIDDEDVQWFPQSDSVELTGLLNPFAKFLESRLKRFSANDELLYWDRDAGLQYRVCMEVALAHAGGDEVLASFLSDGSIGLHEIPAELRPAERIDDRLAWLRSRSAAILQKREEHLAAFETSLDEGLAKVVAGLRACGLGQESGNV